MTAGRQLKALMWKNWKMKLRSWLVVLLELGVSVLLGFGLFYMRQITIKIEIVNSSYTPEGDMFYELKRSHKMIIPYFPKSPAADELMAFVPPKRFGAILIGFNNQTEGFRMTKNGTGEPLSLIVFEDLTSDSKKVPKNLRVKLLCDDRYFDTKYQFNTGAYPTATYRLGGVLNGQKLATEAFIAYWLHKTGAASGDVPFRQMFTLLMPSPAKTTLTFHETINVLMTLLVVFAMLIPFITISSAIVEERQEKLKESMKLMGVTTGIYWLSWFILALVMFTIVALILSTFFCVPGKEGAVFDRTAPGVVYLTLLVYGINCLSYCFLCTCFTKRVAGTTVFTLVTFALLAMVARNEVVEHTMPFNKFLLGVPLFQIGFHEAMRSMIQQEIIGPGVTFSTLNGLPVNGNFSVLYGLLVMLGNTFFNLFLVWYFDNINPGEFGVPQPYIFCFKPSFWCPKAETFTVFPEGLQPDERFFEEEPQNLQPGIILRNLIKVFGGNVAVAGTSMNIYENQITVLLGHNGAGKTTTMAMITGFTPPTSGTAIVNGYDVTKHLAQARKSLGLCPQHDILFKKLNCVDHLKFYCMLRGLVPTWEEISDLLHEVGLGDKMFTQARALSGGQRRKLSVASAVIGNPKVVVLDEPSSGLDPSARREMWSFLKSLRQGRTLLLTTHYMDEADALADRIAIMADGAVRCCGTSMFLKKLYGAGYQLHIVKKPNCNVNLLTAGIKTFIFTVQYRGCTEGEVHYLLMDDTVDQFPKLLRHLEDSLGYYHITSFGLTSTSLEEVFMKVGEGFEPVIDREVAITPGSSNAQFGTLVKQTISSDSVETFSHVEKGNTEIREDDASQNSSVESASVQIRSSQEPVQESLASQEFVPDSSYTPNRGCRRTLQQLRAIFVKKAILTKRSWLTTLLQVATPCLLLILGRYSDERSGAELQPELWFSLDALRASEVTLFTSDDVDEGLAQEYEGQIKAPHKFTKASLGAENGTMAVGEEVTSYYINKMAEQETFKYELTHMVGAALTGTTAIAISSIKAAHGVPIAMNLIMNAAVKTKLGDSYSIQTGVKHVPYEADPDEAQAAALPFTTVITLSLGMAILPALFVHGLIAEREVGAKHLQTVSGIRPILYWLPTFVWDMIVYMVIVGGLMVSFAIYPESFVSHGRWRVSLLLLVIFGVAMLPNTYIFHSFFRSPGQGVTLCILFNIIFGVVGSFTVIGFNLSSSFQFQYKKAVDIAGTILSLICPIYNLAKGFLYLSLIVVFARPEGKFSDFFAPTIYKEEKIELDVSLEPVLNTFIITTAAYIGILLAMEYKCSRTCLYRGMGNTKVALKTLKEEDKADVEDSDVAAEKMRIETTPLTELFTTDALVLKNLVKTFSGFMAVKGTCVGMPERECFGLLGQNGAGKSTIFKMLTGEIAVSGGDAYLLGKSIRSQLSEVQSNMGYCPQFDGLHENLTGRETLYLYGRLRGVPENELKNVTERLISFLTLTPHADKLTRKYSGGNKRKLSVGISLIGSPAFVMLDEPTSGMDPAARRSLWTVMHNVRASGKTIVLTSHSMEECEALCTRIAIQVAGKFKCLGTTQHLKNKFAQGYTVIVQLRTNERVEETVVEAAVKAMLRGAMVFERQEKYLHFQVPESGLPFSAIFETMQNLKKELDLVNYYVQQTTLEQIFLAFVRGAHLSAIAKSSP